jgi:hypothetical protein
VDVVEEQTEEVQHGGDSEYGKNDAQGSGVKGYLLSMKGGCHTRFSKVQ